MRIPLSRRRLLDNIHISQLHVSKSTLEKDEMASAISYKNTAPEASSINSEDVRAAAAMCQYVYDYLKKDRQPELIGGWTLMTKHNVENEIGFGIYERFERTVSGFNSMLFKKEKDGVKYYAYCTEGTEMSSPKDWFSNISQGLIGLAPQYTYSVQNAKMLDKAIGNKSVLWFIGHSLGGGLASNNSLATGRHAITFNAAGLNILRVKATLLLNNRDYLFHYKTRSERIHSFVLQGEILNSFLSILAERAYGVREIVSYNGEKDALGRHALTTLLDEMGVKHD